MDINEPLQHYASPYYDPVKAHEYYMREPENSKGDVPQQSLMMRERKSGLIQKMRFLVRRRKR